MQTVFVLIGLSNCESSCVWRFSYCELKDKIYVQKSEVLCCALDVCERALRFESI